MLMRLGATTRRRAGFSLQVAALFWGVVSEAPRPASWRRTVRASLRSTLTRIVAGSLGTIVATALIVGVGLVFEAVYWLREAGEEASAAPILIAVLFREIAPLLVGIILLGRGGIPMVAEFGTLRAGGEIAVLRGEGVDLFAYLVLPRAVAFAVGAFTLGFVFLLLALLAGYATGSAVGIARTSVFGFLANVLRAMSARDFAIIPAKFVLIGLLVALGCCATAFGAAEDEGPARVLPRAFTRGITVVLVISILLSAAL
jgi:phospholipid/cholesterol/gamma-HCH transport system permease protein